MSREVGPPRRLVATVDVEDWPQSTWDRSLPISDRAARNTERLLELLARHGKRVTMFVLGKFAERFPPIVRRIASEGHEVASHGWGHVEIFRQTPAQFREDVTRAKKILEDIIGSEVAGYRAPDFSIMRPTLWALEELRGAGYRYDSSVFPIVHSRYGIPDWPPEPKRVRLPSGATILELPVGTVDWRGRRWPAAGGGYHRLLPPLIITRAIDRALNQRSVFVAYCHPYEFDPAEFREISVKVPLRVRMHQGLGRGGFGCKFERMLDRFSIVQAAAVAREPWPEWDLAALGPETSTVRAAS